MAGIIANQVDREHSRSVRDDLELRWSRWASHLGVDNAYDLEKWKDRNCARSTVATNRWPRDLFAALNRQFGWVACQRYADSMI